MNVIQPDHSLWKIVFGFMLVVAGLIFVGALALSDADILNLERARAEAAQMNSRTAYDAQRGQIDLSVYPQLAWERSQAQIRMIRAQADHDAAAAAESLRVLQADNDRMLAARTRFDVAKIWFTVLAAVGLLVVVLYVLLVLAQRSIDRLLPPRVAVKGRARVQNAPRPVPARPNFDPWGNPAFRAQMRSRARQRELDEIAKAISIAPPVLATPPLRPNGNGPYHRPMRETSRAM